MPLHQLPGAQVQRRVLWERYVESQVDYRASAESLGRKLREAGADAWQVPQSELVRGHGLRRARYRGLGKMALQNYFIGAACNVKRWIRREVWQLQQAASALATSRVGY